MCNINDARMAIELYLLQSPVLRYAFFVFSVASAFLLWSVLSSNPLTHKRLPWIHFHTLPASINSVTCEELAPISERHCKTRSACVCMYYTSLQQGRSELSVLSIWKGITKLTRKGWPRKFRGWQHYQYSWSCTWRGPIFVLLAFWGNDVLKFCLRRFVNYFEVDVAYERALQGHGDSEASSQSQWYTQSEPLLERTQNFSRILSGNINDGHVAIIFYKQPGSQWVSSIIMRLSSSIEDIAWRSDTSNRDSLLFNVSVCPLKGPIHRLLFVTSSVLYEWLRN